MSGKAAKRRKKVAELMLQGLSQQQIAEQLGIGQATVSRDLLTVNTEKEVAATLKGFEDTARRVEADLARLDEDRSQLPPDHPAHEVLDEKAIKLRRQRDIALDRRARLLDLYPGGRRRADEEKEAEEQGEPGGIPDSFWEFAKRKGYLPDDGVIVRKFPEHLKQGWYRTERGTWRYDPDLKKT